MVRRGELAAWWAQGARSFALRRVDWTGLRATPALLALLWLVPTGLSIGLERLMIPGPARFYAPALLWSGWMGLALCLVVSWWLVVDKPAEAEPPHEPLAVASLLFAQALPLQLVWAVVFVPLSRSGAYADGHPNAQWAQALSYIALAWSLAASGVVLWRASVRPPPARLAAWGVLAGLVLVQHAYAPLYHWYPEPPPTADAGAPKVRLTQAMFEAQDDALARDLAALAPQRAGRIDLYAITYAPYADEEVFGRESEMVAGVMQQRFDAGGRTVQLVNRPDENPRHAWATPLNLQRAIKRVAALMDRDEDVLFLHLTSHGARNGQLASALGALEVEWLTPQRLHEMLEAAGIRQRVISVSACYSGSWIAPLAGEHTLVMTAADAEHTSYGCGRHSELTYFGRAMFDEQLRRTRSFEEAHAAARTVIEQREKEAGKTDGYSNPQIAMGAVVRETLQRLEAQLARD